MNYEWQQINAENYKAEPIELSSYLLGAKKQTDGTWIAVINDEPVGKKPCFPTLKQAQDAAEEAYNRYYCDFEDPSDGF